MDRAGSELHELSACDLADGVRAGRLRAVDVVEHHLGRIERVDRALGAFVHLDAERAQRRAAEVDAKVAAGEDAGPLAGVPLGVKELEDVAGWPHTLACALLAERVAATTSTQVARAADAGAVPVGSTASPEVGSASYTASALHGVTRNPWDPTRTPGGSSGGSAAAVAAGLVPLATGSDSGGSLRIPASFSGVVGFKGTYGRIPRGPGYVGAPNIRNYGVLSRTVRDTLRFLDCVVGSDERDPLSLPHPGYSFEQSVPGVDLAGVRVAWSADLGFATCDPHVVARCRAAADALVAAAGLAEVARPVVLPDPAEAWFVLMVPDLWAGFGQVPDALRAGLSSELQQVLAPAAEFTIDAVIAANAARHVLGSALAELFDEVDLLVLPTTPTSAFAAAGPMPTTIDGREVRPIDSVALTYPFSLSGHPAVSVPAGMVGSSPVGLQIVGRRHDDRLVLAAAAAFERACPWPPLAPDPVG